MEDEIVDIDGEHEEMIDIESSMVDEPMLTVETPPTPQVKREQTQEPMPPPIELPTGPPGARPVTIAQQVAAASTIATRRSSRANITQINFDTSERTTRSATHGTRPRLNFQPKLKLKVNERQASGTSFLGPYDRELDSDDEDLAFEEQFILRMPPGEDSERLREMVEKREISKDVWFKFKGMLHINVPFLGLFLTLDPHRLSPRVISHRQQYIFSQTCRFTMYSRSK